MEREGVPLARDRRDAGWRRALRRRLPVLGWARAYDRTAAVADLVAGTTLGLTLVPQSIAYASLANLPVQYGLYSSFIGTMLYVVLGTVKEVSIGPTSLMALLTLQICRGLPIEFVVLLTFLSGCVVLLMGLLRLGFLVDLISPSVTSGFTSATAVIIVAAQLKGLLGLSFVAESVYDNVRLIARHWPSVRPPDAALGAVCCGLLLALRKLKDVRVSGKRPALQKALWLVSISRNALVVLGASTFAFLSHGPRDPLVRLSGRVEPGLPQVSLPPFSAVVDNSTVTFVGMVQQLGSGVLMMPVVMVLANIAIAKAFTRDGRVDASQEMVTLGLVNVAGSLVLAMPTCGAFTRSAVSHSSGVRSPAAGLYSGIITLLALVFLTQHFYYIPKACLSSVLICAVIFMVDLSTARALWRRDRRELALLLLTFGAGVARSVEGAVLAGALGSLGLLLRALMTPRVALHTHKVGAREAVVARVRGAALYVAAARLGARLARAARAAPRPVLLDCGGLALLDHCGAQMFEQLISKLTSGGQKVIFFNAPEEIVKQLEEIKGVDKRTLRLVSFEDALATIEATPAEETTALLHEKTDDNV